MDYPERREQFSQYYSICLQYIVLNEKLKQSIRSKYPQLWNKIEPSDEAIKSYILLEKTRERESCNEVIKMLVHSKHQNNIYLSECLKSWNRPVPRKWFNNDIYIDVTPVKEHLYPPKDGNTQTHCMTKNPRGKAIVINVVPKEVLSEHKRFGYIFSQLLFDVIVYEELTIAEILANLIEINKQIKEGFNNGDADEALIVMMITHGHDDMVCGKNYVSAVNYNVNDPNDTRYKLAAKDLCHMSQIVDIFKDNRDLVKMFYFICCRKVTQRFMDMALMNSSYANGMDSNTNTFVFYSCAQGYVTPVINHWSQTDPHFTIYGKHLSESIAQFAYYKDLLDIMNKVLRTEGKGLGLTPEQMSLLAPENRLRGSTHKLYFNPCFAKDRDDNWVSVIPTKPRFLIVDQKFPNEKGLIGPIRPIANKKKSYPYHPYK